MMLVLMKITFYENGYRSSCNIRLVAQRCIPFFGKIYHHMDSLHLFALMKTLKKSQAALGKKEENFPFLDRKCDKTGLYKLINLLKNRAVQVSMQYQCHVKISKQQAFYSCKNNQAKELDHRSRFLAYSFPISFQISFSGVTTLLVK